MIYVFVSPLFSNYWQCDKQHVLLAVPRRFPAANEMQEVSNDTDTVRSCQRRSTGA
jgi:hypothetical protein